MSSRSFAKIVISAVLALNIALVDCKNSTILGAGGIIPAVFTPFHNDSSVNLDIIPKYARYFSDMGIKAVLVGGTTGEQMTQTTEERKSVIGAWLAAGRDTGLAVIAQVGGGPLADVLELTTFCASEGVDSILTLPDLYFRPANVDDLVDYVDVVAKSALDTPVLYYHHPKKSFVNLNMPKFVKAATERIPNFKGLKYASSDLNEAYQVLRTLETGQDVLLASDLVLAGASLLGFRSACSGSFNLFPKEFLDIMAAVENNEVLRARELQDKVASALEAIKSEGGLPAKKATMEMVSGLRMGPPRLPLKPLTDGAKKVLQEKLVAIGFKAE